MTAQQQQTIEQALERASREGIRIIGKGHFTDQQAGQRFWLVSSKHYEHTNRAYIVTLGDDAHLHCSCQARGICKHRAVVHQALKAEIEARIVRPPEHAELPACLFCGYHPDRGDGYCSDSCLDRDADRRAEAKRAETQAEIERESAKRVAAGQAPHPYSATFACARPAHETALPAYATDNREFSIFK